MQLLGTGSDEILSAEQGRAREQREREDFLTALLRVLYEATAVMAEGGVGMRVFYIDEEEAPAVHVEAEGVGARAVALVLVTTDRERLRISLPFAVAQSLRDALPALEDE